MSSPKKLLLFDASDVPESHRPQTLLPKALAGAVFAVFGGDHINVLPGSRTRALMDKRRPAWRGLRWVEEVASSLPHATVNELLGPTQYVSADRLICDVYEGGRSRAWHERRWVQRGFEVLALADAIAMEDDIRRDADGLVLWVGLDNGAGTYRFAGSRAALVKLSDELNDSACWTPEALDYGSVDLWVVERGEVARHISVVDFVRVNGVPALAWDGEAPGKVVVDWRAMKLPRPGKGSIRPGEAAVITGWDDIDGGMTLAYGDNPTDTG